MTNNSVAKTIVDQIGDSTMRTIGAHGLVSSDDGLMFCIRGSKRINKIVVKLSPDDTYRLECWKIDTRTWDVKKVSDDDGLYCDDLARVIAERVGIHVSCGV